MSTMPENLQVQRFKGAGGIELVGDVGGDPAAPAVILLHGGGQTRHSWEEAFRSLVTRGYRVISYDARGHGDSAWSPDADYTLDSVVEDLRCVIATLRTRPALVGASMGGATALYLVGTSTVPIASALIMVDIVPLIHEEGAQRIRAFMAAHPQGFATLEEAAAAVAAYNPHRPRPADNSGLMKNLRRRADGRLHWHWDPRFLTNRQRVEPPVLRERLRAAAGQVKIPTLLVRGLQSDIVSEEGVIDFKARVPHLEVFDVSGAGHMVAGDKNDAFNQGVFDFLQRYVPFAA